MHSVAFRFQGLGEKLATDFVVVGDQNDGAHAVDPMGARASAGK
jgi:hypothetical protein